MLVLCCLGLVGLRLAETLANEAFQTDKHYVDKFNYLFAYIWLMGVVLYLLCEPILAEIRQQRYILNQNCPKTHNS